MNRKNKIIFVITLFIVFNNCGFTPMYKISDSEVNLRNYSVKIVNQVSREISQEVDANIFPSSEVAYEVMLNIKDDQIPLIINTNGTVAKYRIEVVINFEIVEINSNNVIDSGVSRGFSQYEVGASEIDNEDTKKSMIKSATKNALQIMVSKVEGSIARSNDN